MIQMGKGTWEKIRTPGNRKRTNLSVERSFGEQIELTGATRKVSSIEFYPVFKPGKCTSPQIGKAFEENTHVCFSIRVRALFLVHLFAKQDDTYIKHSNLRSVKNISYV